jgi:hypothetical protein
MLSGGIGKSGAREMPEREPHGPAELAFDLLDRVEGLPGVRALVIAVLDDLAAGGVRVKCLVDQFVGNAKPVVVRAVWVVHAGLDHVAKDI